MANPLCHFEFMVKDIAKSKGFYGKVFDWKFGDMPGIADYVSIDTGKDPGGGVMKKPDQAPGCSLMVYFYVESIEETLGKVTAAGGKIGKPKVEITGIGWWALFFDPDGIPVMIFEAKK
jgi:predicted enzyme related to lactoylglutathione lyase